MNIFKWGCLCALSISIAACTTFPTRNIEPDPNAGCIQPIGVDGERETCGKDAIYQIKLSKSDPKSDLISRMYILEINDQGLIVNPKTAKVALEHLRTSMENDNKPLVSLFVHGWNNNGQADNGDLINFEQAVMALNASQENPKSEVFGIYVSWRGKTMPSGLSHAFTFWGRKAISEEVGRGQLANFIFELESIVKPNLKAADKETVDQTKNGKLILSGHSFGASALYNAVGHELMSRFYSSIQKQKEEPKKPHEIRGVGDIVVLLNPAIQALRFHGLRETVYEKAVENKDIFQYNKAPIFMMVATEDDLPVETAFPIGRTISHFLSHNAHDKMDVHDGINGEKIKTSIKQAERNSIGFYQPYYTHFLLLADNIEPRPESAVYRIANATEKVITLPKKVIETQDVLEASKTIFNVSKDLLQTPQKVLEEVNYQAPANQSHALNIGHCLSDAVVKEFEGGDRKEIDWLKESVHESEYFSTVTTTDGSPNKAIDLLKLKITNNPKSLKPAIINQWPLVQQYQDRKVLSWAKNPYWFVKAKSNVMQGHSGIWDKNVACLLLSVMAREPISLQFMKENDQLTQAPESQEIPEPNKDLQQSDDLISNKLEQSQTEATEAQIEPKAEAEVSEEQAIEIALTTED